ncbi:MAG: hypothetical protein US89_C0013G0045 [Candidatus Peregrinibacteria bacterium GW2011_GWF2_38_29]|nr:MAG: hypothetical protein US89_C0013G0045 [Candidatus Peregrinibacteria bacterium GW2011_GWF2_38_29]
MSPIALAYAVPKSEEVKGSWDLLKPAQIDGVNTGKELEYLRSLPQADTITKDIEAKTTATFYASATKLMMGLATILVVVGFFVAGVMYVTAQGNEEVTKKAVNIMMYTVVGVIIIAAAYGIVIGITKLKPF